MRWRARTIVQLHGALRACRPQLKRDPLGSGGAPVLAHDSDDPMLPIAQRVAAYVAILGVVIGGALLAHKWFLFDVRRAAASLLGIIYLLAASRRPWWLFYTMRHRAFRRMDDDLIRILFLAVGCALLGLGALWHPRQV